MNRNTNTGVPFFEGGPDVATALGQSLAAVNMKLVRLRRALLECSRQSLAGEEIVT